MMWLSDTARKYSYTCSLVLQTLFKNDMLRRSQDGGGLGRGDHFLSYKFIERTIER